MLVKHMVGRSIDQFYPKDKPGRGPLLAVEGLSRTGF